MTPKEPIAIQSEEINAGNKLIAEFMGLNMETAIYSFRVGVQEKLQDHHLNYHASWGWLMPVVEKIESLGYDSRIHGNNSDGGFICDFVDADNYEAGCRVSYVSKIEAVYGACLDFIRYYNEQSKTTPS